MRTRSADTWTTRTVSSDLEFFFTLQDEFWQKKKKQEKQMYVASWRILACPTRVTGMVRHFEERSSAR